MRVYNNTSFTIIAYCWDDRYGFGEDVSIEPDETIDVPGPIDPEKARYPYKGVMAMEITCHDNPDDNIDLYVNIDKQLCTGSGPTGITVRHNSEEREIQEVTTACGNTFHVDTKGCEQFGFTSGEKVFVVKTEVYAIIRGTSKKPPGMKACCAEVGAEVLWIQVEGDEHVSIIFHPDISLKRI